MMDDSRERFNIADEDVNDTVRGWHATLMMMKMDIKDIVLTTKI